MNGNRVIKNCETIELKISDAGKTKFNFEPSSDIEKRKVTAIEIMSPTICSKSPIGNTVLTDTALKEAFLTLSTGGAERVKDLPVESLIALNNNGLVKNFDAMKLELPKCYIRFASTSNLTTGHVVLIVFYFED